MTVPNCINGNSFKIISYLKISAAYITSKYKYHKLIYLCMWKQLYYSAFDPKLPNYHSLIECPKSYLNPIIIGANI